MVCDQVLMLRDEMVIFRSKIWCSLNLLGPICSIMQEGNAFYSSHYNYLKLRSGQEKSRRVYSMGGSALETQVMTIMVMIEKQLESH